MAGHPHKHFEKYYWMVCLLVFLVVVMRCIFVPFSHDEVATFYFYIQPGKFIPFYSHPDANGHFLMSASSWVFYKLLGSAPVVLRIPCMLAFVVMCYGVFRMNKLFTSLLAKLIFSSAFILSFNFINFYSLCRGYGLSIAFLLLALYYFFVYLRYFSFSHFLKFLLCSQVALSANLTLVFVLLLTTGVIVIFQARQHKLFQARNLLVLFIHLAMIGYWVKYAFFLKESGALYYGGGESYWTVTFRSLIETITMNSDIINALVLLLFTGMGINCVFVVYRRGISEIFRNDFVICFGMLVLLIISFYLLKAFLHVNYPEDRTGLFFYVFFMLSLAFMINDFRNGLQLVFIYIPLFFIVHFVFSINITAHAWRTYETMPYSFYAILRSEQLKTTRNITVAGHRVREFFYGFINFNSPLKLNHMTAPEALQMNCDYALAYRWEKPEYDRYYTELATDNYWQFALLKRRQPIQRILMEEQVQVNMEGEYEYYNVLEHLDTTFITNEPLQASFTLSFDSVPVPFNAWLVLQIDGDDPSTNVFVRTPLNLIKQNWNGTTEHTIDLVSGNIPVKIRRVVAYLWNIDKQKIKIRSSFRLYRLKGDGVTVISKANL